MINQCTLCGAADIEFVMRFPDVNGDLIDFYECGQCDSLVPSFELNDHGDAVWQQVRFHEDWWKDSAAEDLERNLRSMASVVSSLQSMMGLPHEGVGAAVVEVGCGRGTMLRALIDAGYLALGCEPSAKLAEIACTHYGVPRDALFEMTAQEFLIGPVFRLAQPPRAVILWHVLEHLADPLSLFSLAHGVLPFGGHLILQLPVLHQPYIYPEHYFFVNDSTLHYLAARCGFLVVSLEYDKDNFFITACLRKTELIQDSVSNSKDLLTHTNAIAKAILLRDRLIAEKRTLIEERWLAMQSMETMIRERDEAIAGQAQMLEERWLAMQSMETMIRERDEAIIELRQLLGKRPTTTEAMRVLLSSAKASIQHRCKAICANLTR